MLVDQASIYDDRKSLVDFKYHNTIPQSLWYTCGPAALATYLKYFLDLNVDEDTIISMSVEEAKRSGEDYEYGISASVLSTVAGKFDVKAVGYKVEANEIGDFFKEFKQPALMYLTKPEKHFVLVFSLGGQDIAVMDPSSGLKRENYNIYSLERGYGGVMVNLKSSKNEDLSAAYNIADYLDKRDVILKSLGRP